MKKAVIQLLANAVQSVPPGAWAIGVSGGADSVALLTLLRSRTDLSLHVVHLNHQTRGSQSEGDAEFVAQLAKDLGLPFAIDQRLTMERELPDLPRNPSARYRRLRIELFHRVVQERTLLGVLLAHHADDQAETILHRLLRGSGVGGLAGMSIDGVVAGLRCFRPLLNVQRESLRQWLRENNQPWREDPSNRSPKYLRNRLRVLLTGDSELSDALMELGTACAALRGWERSAIAPAGPTLNCREIAELPRILARTSARNWLIAQGVASDKIAPKTIDRLLAMCLDASTPAREQFPGGAVVARRKGMIEKVGSKSEIRSPNSEPG